MTIRIGIIGGSGHFGYAVEGVSELDDAVISAIAPGCEDEDISNVLSVPAIAANSPKTYDDYLEMLKSERLDIVAVNPFYYLHSEITANALKSGVAVFCEKPLALDLQSLDELQSVQGRSGRPVGMMLAFRYEPMFYTAYRLVKDGVIGEPIDGYAQKSYKLGVRPWFYEKRETFGGIIPWVGIHAIDWFSWISGRQYISATCRHGNIHALSYPEMEDHATCLFTLDNGGSAVMSFDYLRPAGAATHGDDRLRLAGSKGVIDIRHPAALDVVTDQGALDIKLESPKYGIFADFALSVIDDRHKCLISAADAFKMTEIALKARDAADCESTVTF